VSSGPLMTRLFNSFRADRRRRRGPVTHGGPSTRVWDLRWAVIKAETVRGFAVPAGISQCRQAGRAACGPALLGPGDSEFFSFSLAKSNVRTSSTSRSRTTVACGCGLTESKGNERLAQIVHSTVPNSSLR
jgi:hypothetical protein